MKDELINRLANLFSRTGNLEGVCGIRTGEEPAIEAGHLDDYILLDVLSRLLSNGSLTLQIAPEAASHLALLLHFSEEEISELEAELKTGGNNSSIQGLLNEAKQKIIKDPSVGRKQAEGAIKAIHLIRKIAEENEAKYQHIDFVLEKIASEHPYKIPGDPDSYSQYNEAWQDCLARVDQELSMVKGIEWIPIGEGYPLPEEKINPITQDYYAYPVTVEINGVRDVRYYKFGRGHWWHGPAHMDHYVKAWLPVPDPYADPDEK